MATSFAAGALGTDTSGSITGPSNANGIVGLRPTRGLLSRHGIVPITELQDTAGPMARSVTDVAMMLTVLAGSDAADPRTEGADTHKVDYAKTIDPTRLKGARIGVLRAGGREAEKVGPLFDQALEVLKAQGAELVEVQGPLENLNDIGLQAEAYNFKHDIAAYLASAPPAVKARTVDDLLAFNKTDPRETKISNLYWEEAAATSGDLQDPKYLELLATIQRKAGPEGYDAIFSQNNLTAFVTPSGGPAGVPPADGTPRQGGRGDGPGSFTRNAAIGGYPILSVPMGNVEGMPVDISFVGPQWSEQTLLSYGKAYEQAGYKRVPPEAYKKAQAK
jgi:amidase